MIKAFGPSRFDPALRLKGVIAPSNEETSGITFHRVVEARKRSPRVKQRQTPMFVRLSTLDYYDFTEKTALVPKTRV